MSSIAYLNAREIIDSRGNPTVEVEVITADGVKGRAAVPSGASTGRFEAHELRDGDAQRYHGKGVLKALKNIRELIAPALNGHDVFYQQAIDKILLELDGTPNKKKLGANAMLAVSLACAHAAARTCQLPLYRYLGGARATRLPVPMVNIINGGEHANNDLAFQEFMVVPHGLKSFASAMQASAEIFHTLKKILQKNKLSTAVGDEGGFAPQLDNEEQALDLVLTAITEAGYDPQREVSLALDVAASEFYKNKKYCLHKHKLTNKEMVAHLVELCDKYPIISVEDGFDQEDWAGFALLTEKIGKRVKIVGDDLFVTNRARLLQGKAKSAGNAILIKLNQIGTLSETLDTIATADNIGYATIISHRSGETEDTTIADLAVATSSDMIKSGSLCRSERLCKYNQLLRIEEELGQAAQFRGTAIKTN